jgi:hypothetical protein
MSETKLTRFQPNHLGYMVPLPSGPYVSYSDADARIAELEAACRVLGEEANLYRYYNKQSDTGFSDDEWNAFCGRKRACRAATNAHPIASKYVKETT